MAGFIVLEDGRANAISNNATDLLLEAVAPYLRNAEFRSWLLDQRSSVVGPGLTRLDLRELTQENRDDFRRATRQACAQLPLSLERGHDDYWLIAGALSVLVEMMDRVDRGEPAEDFNPHMHELIPETGAHRGPGWQ